MTLRRLFYPGFSVALLLGTVTLCQAQYAEAAPPSKPSAPVHDVDNPARQPVQFNFIVNFTDGNNSATVNGSFTVPSGKRLVIETITGEVLVREGQQIRAQLITTAAGNFNPNHSLVFDSKVTFGAQDVYRATLPVRFYADPGTTVVLQIGRNSGVGSTGNGEVTFSGYLVNIS